MWKPRRPAVRNGWLVPDALVALGIVTLTVLLAQQTLTVTQHNEQIRTARLRQVRARHDQALLKWAANQ